MRTKDGLIHYRREGRGTPLVLVHGVGASFRSWDRATELLSRDFDVLRLDLRGHGESAVIEGAYSIDAFASDVIRVMDEAGVGRAHLAGFSLGGLIAQRLAHGWQDRFLRVVILSAVAGRTDQEREKVVSRLELLREGGIDAVTGAATDRWFTGDFARRHPEVIERRITELKGVHLPSYMEAYRVFGTTELVDTLHEITAPTLVMTGEFDQGSNTRMAETMHRLIPDSELQILQGLKHSVLVEASDDVAGRICTFLKRHTLQSQGKTDG